MQKITEQMLKECCERLIDEIQGTMRYLANNNGYISMQFGKTENRPAIVHYFGKVESDDDLWVYLELRNEYIRDHFTEIFNKNKIELLCKKYGIIKEYVPTLTKSPHYIEIEMNDKTLDLTCVKGDICRTRKERSKQIHGFDFGGIYYANCKNAISSSRKLILIVQRRESISTQYVLTCPLVTEQPGRNHSYDRYEFPSDIPNVNRAFYVIWDQLTPTHIHSIEQKKIAQINPLDIPLY